MAFERIEPWGEERADWRAGMVASVIANVHRGKGTPARKPEDFMPRFTRGKGHQTVEEQMAVWNQFVVAHNKAVERAERRKQGGVGRGDDRELSG